MTPDWWPDWRGHSAAIIASGPSATREQAETARRLGAKVVAVNRSYELAPWADAVYACEWRTWESYPRMLDLPGIKIMHADRQAPINAQKHGVWQQMLRPASESLVFDGHEIGAGRHSGFQALNLVVRWGANPIALIGFDYTGGHWHEPHTGRLTNPTSHGMLLWAKSMDKAVDVLAKKRIRVYNCSPISLLTRYPKVTVEEALGNESRLCAKVG